MTCERCRELADELRDLKARARVDALRAAFGLTLGEAKVLLALFEAGGRAMDAAQVLAAVPARDHVKERGLDQAKTRVRVLRNRMGVRVSRVRDCLDGGRQSIIRATRGVGYSLTPAGLRMVADALGEGR